MPANGDYIKDPSPFPSGSDMDMDMWRASNVNPDGTRYIETVGNSYVAKVYGPGDSGEQGRDQWARRIEMLGDLYEGLRRAAEKMQAAGMDVAEESEILSEFITPKPFPEGR